MLILWVGIWSSRTSERVVIVDFDLAQVERSEGERRRWADWVFFKDAFGVPEEV